ncbi:MAG: hypothetical protein M3P85_00615 [Actinomycetota bacterium]|nr:hypothetical protein [Actinomycetota bacterium]
MPRSLVDDNPLLALVVGIGITIAGWAWWQYEEAHREWLARHFGERTREITTAPWYRVVNVYGGAIFLAVAGISMVVAASFKLF